MTASERMRALHADTEFKARHAARSSVAMRARNADPAFAARRLSAVRDAHARRNAFIDRCVVETLAAGNVQSVDQLVSLSGFSKTTIQRSLKRLSAADVLTCRSKRGRGTTFTLTDRAAGLPGSAAPASPAAAADRGGADDSLTSET